jgi:hypothetical protein
VNPKDKFILYASVVAALGVSNNIGFRGNCEIREAEPACKGIAPEPLHTHEHHALMAYGTSTSTISSVGNMVTGTGALSASAAIIEGSDIAAGSITVGNVSAVGFSGSSGVADMQGLLPNDEVADFVMNLQDDHLDEGLMVGVYDSAPVQTEASGTA